MLSKEMANKRAKNEQQILDRKKSNDTTEDVSYVNNCSVTICRTQ